MSKLSFADRYKEAGLEPSPEIIKMRQASFGRIRKALDIENSFDLARVYFGLLIPAPDWFRDEFVKDDASFSLISNQREACLLAAIILAAAIEDGDGAALLVVLTTWANGARKPKIAPWLIKDARDAANLLSVSARTRVSIDSRAIRLPTPVKVEPEIGSLPVNDWEALKGVLRKIEGESFEWSKTLANQSASIVVPMLQQMIDLREEADMLWWLTGEHSRNLEQPYMTFDLGPAALLSGLEMAQLTRSQLGPVAAPAMMTRMMRLARKPKGAKINLASVVDSFTPSDLERLLGETIAPDGYPDLFPVLTALTKAREMGQKSWHASFKKSTLLEPSADFDASGLALQTYREVLLGKLVK